MTSPLSENITTIVKSSETSVIGLMRRDKSLLIPFPALGLEQHEPRQHPGKEGNTQINQHTLSNRPDGDPRQVHIPKLDTKQRWQHFDKQPCIDRVKEHLKDRVERDQTGRIFGIALGQLVPDDHHGDAPGQADHDEADGVFRPIREEREGQAEHQQRTDHPILDEGQHQYPCVAEDFGQLFVFHLGQRRIHHQD